MKNIDIAGIRAARSFARISPRRHRRGSFSALAAPLAACFALTWGAPSEATPTPASVVAASGSNSDVLALQEGCEREDAVSCNDLGVTYLKGYGVPVDVRAALRAFERSCQHGNPDGCGNLGALYESGLGVVASLTEATWLYEQACSMGCALACSNLGALYARGRGVARDIDEARRLFTHACETGSAAGCNNLLQFPTPRL
jgi:TPR repeat protein